MLHNRSLPLNLFTCITKPTQIKKRIFLFQGTVVVVISDIFPLNLNLINNVKNIDVFL